LPDAREILGKRVQEHDQIVGVDRRPTLDVFIRQQREHRTAVRLSD
jgi:hypothetical protein